MDQNEFYVPSRDTEFYTGAAPRTEGWVSRRARFRKMMKRINALLTTAAVVAVAGTAVTQAAYPPCPECGKVRCGYWDGDRVNYSIATFVYTENVPNLACNYPAAAENVLSTDFILSGQKLVDVDRSAYACTYTNITLGSRLPNGKQVVAAFPLEDALHFACIGGENGRIFTEYYANDAEFERIGEAGDILCMGLYSESTPNEITAWNSKKVWLENPAEYTCRKIQRIWDDEDFYISYWFKPPIEPETVDAIIEKTVCYRSDNTVKEYALGATMCLHPGLSDLNRAISRNIFSMLPNVAVEPGHEGIEYSFFATGLNASYLAVVGKGDRIAILDSFHELYENAENAGHAAVWDPVRVEDVSIHGIRYAVYLMRYSEDGGQPETRTVSFVPLQEPNVMLQQRYLSGEAYAFPFDKYTVGSLDEVCPLWRTVFPDVYPYCGQEQPPIIEEDSEYALSAPVEAEQMKMYQNSYTTDWGARWEFLTLENGSDLTLDARVAAKIRNASGDLIRTEYASFNVLGPGQKDTCAFSLYNAPQDAYVEYEMQYTRSSMESFRDDIRLETEIGRDGNLVILTENTGTQDISKCTSMVLLFDEEGKLLKHEEMPLYNRNGVLPAGGMDGRSVWCEQKFDHFEVYFSGTPVAKDLHAGTVDESEIEITEHSGWGTILEIRNSLDKPIGVEALAVCRDRKGKLTYVGKTTLNAIPAHGEAGMSAYTPDTAQWYMTYTEGIDAWSETMELTDELIDNRTVLLHADYHGLDQNQYSLSAVVEFLDSRDKLLDYEVVYFQDELEQTVEYYRSFDHYKVLWSVNDQYSK